MWGSQIAESDILELKLVHYWLCQLCLRVGSFGLITHLHIFAWSNHRFASRVQLVQLAIDAYQGSFGATEAIIGKLLSLDDHPDLCSHPAGLLRKALA